VSGKNVCLFSRSALIFFWDRQNSLPIWKPMMAAPFAASFFSRSSGMFLGNIIQRAVGRDLEKSGDRGYR